MIAVMGPPAKEMLQRSDYVTEFFYIDGTTPIPLFSIYEAVTADDEI